MRTVINVFIIFLLILNLSGIVTIKLYKDGYTPDTSMLYSLTDYDECSRDLGVNYTPANSEQKEVRIKDLNVEIVYSLMIDDRPQSRFSLDRWISRNPLPESVKVEVSQKGTKVVAQSLYKKICLNNISEDSAEFDILVTLQAIEGLNYYYDGLNSQVDFMKSVILMTNIAILIFLLPMILLVMAKERKSRQQKTKNPL